MASKKEEERNEKIIRGLMKLPPNRRCINCNNLGPQYVCTNFWTFVCMICSGIHREFTHRVKSVSMSKFTSQEVEALQNGGNQRAREIYLKDWNLQRQRVPDISNVDKVREFIKAVYVERKYAAGNKSDKPPRDMQGHKSGDDFQRASSYHSFSQSPPYDFQYEERVKRNQGGSLVRKPGIDHRLFERKAASFIYSPGRFSDHIYEDRFTNSVASSRVSDYSVSSGGDPFRSGPQSPNFQNDGSSNLNDSMSGIDDGLQLRKTISNPEANTKKDADKTIPAGNTGSTGSNSESRQSVDTGSLFDACLEPNQSSAPQKSASAFPFIPQPAQENFADFNRFKDSSGMLSFNAAPDISLFQPPATGSIASIDLFQSPTNSSVLSHNFRNSSEFSTIPVSVNLTEKLPKPCGPSDEGWATFDTPQLSKSIANCESATVLAAHCEDGISLTNISSVSTSNIEMQWINFQSSTVDPPPSLVSNPWDEGLLNVHVSTNVLSSQPWRAFEEYNEQHQSVDPQGTSLQASLANPSSTTNQDLDFKIRQGSFVDGFQDVVSGEGVSFPTSVSHNALGPSFTLSVVPLMDEIVQTGQKSGNPFDIDSELEVSNAFLDLSTLQTALPSPPLPSYASGINESWIPSNPVAYQDGMRYMSVQASSSQLPNVQAPGTVVSIGGNPFA